MSTKPTRKRTVACPTCRRSVEWSAANPWRPFCSERCKLIDLGAWATQERYIRGSDAERPAEGEPSGEA